MHRSAPDPAWHHPLPPVEMVPVEGGRICCVDLAATGGAPASEPLLLLPGLVSTHRYFRANIGPLSQMRRVIALDLPGFGRSDKPNASYSIPWYVEQVVRFLDRKNIPRAHFAGNSLGGQIALALALAHPQRVARLVVVSPSGFTAWPAMYMAILDAAGRLTMNTSGLPRLPRVPRAGLALLFKTAFPTRPDLAARYTRSYFAGLATPEYPLYVRAAFRAVRGSLASPMMADASLITAPTLIVWGVKDRILPARPARALKRALADAVLLLYKDSGHCPMTDSPERWNRDVNRFLDGAAPVD